MEMETQEPPQIIEGLVSVGYNILAGTPKAGKSWLSLNLALCVATGNKVFGQYKVAKGNVLYCALEDHYHRLKKRLKVIGSKIAMPEDLLFTTKIPTLQEGGLEELHDYMQKKAPKLVIIDTLGKVSEEKGGDIYQEDYGQGSALQEIAFLNGCAVLVVHHATKGKQQGINQVSGTAGVTAAADGVMVLSRTSITEATLFATGRDSEEKKLELEWYPPGGGWVFKHKEQASYMPSQYME
jgi:RecA-family ATPase